MLGCTDFAGVWTLRRTIDDRHSGQQGAFHGTATMQNTDACVLDYHESGHIRFGKGPALSAHRSYHWIFGEGHVAVRFADGSRFHSFVPQGQVAGTDHPCGNDYYTVSYDFTDWPNWTATWVVTGPRKDYTSVSHYTRA